MIMKKATGLVAAVILAYVWMYVISFIGDAQFDFDNDTILKLIEGNTTLYEVFGGHNGTKWAFYVLTGADYRDDSNLPRRSGSSFPSFSCLCPFSA